MLPSAHIYQQSVYHVQDLQCICHYLDLDDAKLLATVLVSSRLDYCNPLLCGIADIDLTRLHHVHNQVALLKTKSSPFTCSVPLLRSLHSLQVRFRIMFKINFLTYKPFIKNSLFILMHACRITSIPFTEIERR